MFKTIFEIIRADRIPDKAQFIRVVSGKFGATASFINLMDKYKNGTDTVSDWLGVGADLATIVAGYTANPFVAGVATALGIASFQTSDTAKIMAGIWLDSVNKYGLFDAETGQFILPPGVLDSFLSSEGPICQTRKTMPAPLLLTSTAMASKPYPSAVVFSSIMMITRLRESQQGLRQSILSA
jgi:hypothetical protein